MADQLENKSQTLESLFLSLSEWEIPILISMFGITLISCLGALLFKKMKADKAANRFMTIPVFITTFPGIFCSLILAYLLFFTNTNLMKTSLFFFIPPLWLLVSLFLFSKIVKLDDVPGFEHISGLMFFALFSFVIILGLYKLRILAIAFFSPIWAVGLVAFIYIVWRASYKKMVSKP